ANIAVSWGKPPPGAFDRGINPILELGQNLRRTNPVTALTYTTTAGHAQYLKVLDLLDFTGKAWRPNESVKYGRIEGNVGLDPRIKRKVITTRITIHSLSSPRVPVPYPALEMDGLKGDWRWEPQGLTLVSDTDDASGQKYMIQSLQIAPTLAQMRNSATHIGPTLERYVSLPKMPPSIARVALDVTQGLTNDYDKAIALQNYFRNGGFAYSTSAPVADGYDGSGVDVIARFLEVKRGYCVHFSSAMAVMARTLDIPARIAVGYAPGAEAGTTKDRKITYEATSNELHAWPELYFDGIGWVAFEPTPGVGDPTDFGGATGTDVGPDPGGSTATDNGTRRPDRSLIDNSRSRASDKGPASRSGSIVLAGLALLLILPFGLRRVQRMWRLRGPRPSASRLWTELEFTARDYGVFVTVSETPRAFAKELSARPGMNGEALTGLLGAVERERFGPPAMDGVDAAAAQPDFAMVMRSLRVGGTRRQRLRAVIFPRSLLGPTTSEPRSPAT
ncbi:MAG: DUF3488 and transglutaminase-like domain-containing protein, partial [Aeromicrobium sp.]